MLIVNMLKAKSSLSQLVDAVESGAEPQVIIARNGRPAAKLVRADASDMGAMRIGVAKGRFEIPDDIDQPNEQIAKLFGC